MQNTSNKPLVSIGIPTYNRPEGLLRAVISVINQTYKDIEIIISNNSPNNHHYEKIINFLSLKSTKIKYYKQNKNIGAIDNFKFVLQMATGHYFMWVGDDDILEPYFIKECLEVLSNNNGCAAVTMEAQYFSENEIYNSFNEGSAFYTPVTTETKNRITHIIKNNYGNLWYSLFPTKNLMDEKTNIFDSAKLNSLNEIPLFIQIASIGYWIVINKIGYHKNTNLKTYMQARWEIFGGDIPNSKEIIKNKFIINKYHKDAIYNILISIQKTNITNKEKNKAKLISAKYINSHYEKIIKSASHHNQDNKIFLGLPVYNGEKHIERSIKSIISQKYSNWRLFISDSNSTDNTYNICKKYADIDNRIVLVKKKINLGTTHNFEYTLKSSDCPFFKWVRYNEILNPYFLQNCMNELLANKELDLSFSNISEIDLTDKPSKTYDFNKTNFANSKAINTCKFLFSHEIEENSKLIYSVFKTEFCQKIWDIFYSNKAFD